MPPLAGAGQHNGAVTHAHSGPLGARGSGFDVSVRDRRRMVTAIAVLGVLTLVGIVVLRPTGGDRPDVRRLGLISKVEHATVQSVQTGLCPGTAPEDGAVCDVVTARLTDGPNRGERIRLDFPLDSPAPDLSDGDRIVVAEAEGTYQFVDRDRGRVLVGLAALFALAVVVLGRARGLAALAGLAVSLAMLLWFTLPAIIDGRSPLLVAVVTAAVIAFLALYLAHGFSAMTTVALLGTLASLALTAVLGLVFVWLAQFSGFATEESLYLQVAGGRIDMQGLLLAGIVIGALGAIDDVTVTQASAVWELRAANAALGAHELYAAGLRIGRDHVASTVNTLVLAYAGAALPLLLLFVLSEQSLATVANGEAVAVEIVRTLVGSMGLVSSVPVTTWLAARIVVGMSDAGSASPPDASSPDAASRDSGDGPSGEA